jgi:two-component system cell cycle sensor histidine kinase/response regulator CckA
MAEADDEARWFEQQIHPDDRARALSSLQEALAMKERWSTELRFARADGSFSHVLIRGLVVTDWRGEPVRVIGAIFDITERLRMQHQLEQHRRIESLGRVATTVAHEFNNVLMGIVPFAERMSRERVSDADQARMLGFITGSIARGRRLTAQILTFSTPPAPQPILTALDEWLHELMPELRALAPDGIDLRVDTRGASPAVLIDPPQMQQVLSNLVLNARDAMSRGGTITISAKTRGDTVFLTVSDEGTGMSPATAEQIFEPLFTTKRGGTGLGLAVAQQIIARHHGSIHVASELGKGTTFTIVLPLADADADAATRTGTHE